MSTEVKSVIEKIIRSIAQERSLPLSAFNDSSEIVDELGFSSLTVAALIASLEEELGVDPFQQDDVMITDIRTVGDLRRVYERCLATA